MTTDPEQQPVAGDMGPAALQTLSELVQMRQPLEAGLHAMAMDLNRGRQRTQILNLARELQRGAPLADVLSSSRFPEDLRELIRAGLETGQLPQLLNEFSDEQQEFQESRWRLRFFTLYALLMTSFTFFITAFLLSQLRLVLRFSRDFQMLLPGITEVNLFVLDYVWVLISIPFVGLLLAWICGRIFPVQAWAWFYWIPIVGRIFYWHGFGRACRILSLMLQSRTPLPRSMGITARTTRHPLAKAAFRQLEQKLEQGSSIQDSVWQVSSLPSSLREVLYHTQAVESLQSLLCHLAELYRSRARELMSWFAIIWEPVMFLFCGFMILQGMFAAFLPMVKLLNELS